MELDLMPKRLTPAPALQPPCETAFGSSVTGREAGEGRVSLAGGQGEM